MRIVFFCIALFLAGCHVHKAGKLDRPCVHIPQNYYAEEAGTRVVENWWEEFQQPTLNDLVEKSLRNNLDIAQAWNRLSQAKFQAIIDGAERYPQINMITSVLRSNGGGGFGIDTGTGIVEPGVPPTQGAAFSGNRSFTQYSLGFDLAYELDIWRRIDSKTRAGFYNMYATCEDLEATALVLTGTVTDLWFTIQEQLALLDLFNKQIEVNRTLLELVELRFSIGDASALDVYQQRLQLAQTESQVPPVQSLLRTSSNQMDVLIGEAPGKLRDEETEVLFHSLPPFPQLGTPIDLLHHRPDLKAVQRRLKQADFLVAEAVADLFPKLSLFLTYDFSAIQLRDLVDRELYSIAGNLLFPLIDGGRRRAEMNKRKAVVCERLNEFGESFLTALREVEDSLAEESYQIDLLEDLDKQVSLAESNLREARLRYMNGLSDYLPVIAAIQSLQTVQRRIISERKRLLQTRAKLYRSLGGTCLVANCCCP